MATFQIHEDAEKENPFMPLLREKLAIAPNAKTVVNNNNNNNNAKTTTNSNNVTNQQQQQQRMHLASLNANKKKLQAFRDLKAKVHDENASYAKKLETTENLKAFTIYEDVPLQSIKTNTKNVLGEIKIEQTAASTFAELSQDNNNYALDTTPMSVSDVLSPMSVDRSHTTAQIDLQDLDADAENHENHKSIKLSSILAPQSDANNHGKLNLANKERDRFFEMIEYQVDILKYLRESELKHRPKPLYMRRQGDINNAMRTILVDWLVEVAEEYNLNTETVYLSVSYIDRFLSQMSVMRNKLQLVGTAAMYIAAKYEEIYPPEVSDFVYITDDTFNKAQVLRMEQIVLKILSFDLCTPTPYVYMNIYAVMTDMPELVKMLALYISELSLLEGDPYLHFLPSLISSAALALARLTLNYAIWSPQLEEITSYKLKDMKELFLYLSKSHKTSQMLKLQAIQDKYKTEQYLEVASIEPLEAISAEKFDLLIAEYEFLTRPAQGQENVSMTFSAKMNENMRNILYSASNSHTETTAGILQNNNGENNHSETKAL